MTVSGSASSGSCLRLPTTLTTVVASGASPSVPITSLVAARVPDQQDMKPFAGVLFSFGMNFGHERAGRVNGRQTQRLCPLPDTRADTVRGKNHCVGERFAASLCTLPQWFQLVKFFDKVDAVFRAQPPPPPCRYGRWRDRQPNFSPCAPRSAAASSTA